MDNYLLKNATKNNVYLPDWRYTVDSEGSYVFYWSWKWWTLMQEWDIFEIKDNLIKFIKSRQTNKESIIYESYDYITGNAKYIKNEKTEEEKYFYFMDTFYNKIGADLYDYNNDLDKLVREITWYKGKNSFFD